MRAIPQQCIDLVKAEEGCVLHPYRDCVGRWTVGTGHLILANEHFDDVITPDQSDALLAADMTAAANLVAMFVTVPINDNQYSALISFTFNEGGGALHTSTLLREINAGVTDPGQIAADFGMWTKVRNPNTKQMCTLPDLVRRRGHEAALYNTPMPAQAV